MSDGARLTAAISFAAIAFLLSSLMIPLFLGTFGNTTFGWFTWVNVGLAIVIGWRGFGAQAGAGMLAAMMNGITSLVVLLVSALLVQSGNEMIRLSMMKRYDGPGDALVGGVEIFLRWGTLYLNVTFIVTAVVGAALAGMITELAWRRWR